MKSLKKLLELSYKFAADGKLPLTIHDCKQSNIVVLLCLDSHGATVRSCQKARSCQVTELGPGSLHGSFA